MAERDYNETSKNRRMNELDIALDAALAKYATVEPRVGLERRILANLNAQPPAPEIRLWWRWGVAAALAVVLLALGLAWKGTRTPRPLIVNRHASVTDVQHSSAKELPRQIAENPPAPRSATRKHRKAGESVTVASAPKREQFPSPQPLSEQEQLLASYVTKNPQHALLIA